MNENFFTPISLRLKFCKHVRSVEVNNFIKFHLQLTLQCKDMATARSMLQNLNSKLRIDNLFTQALLNLKFFKHVRPVKINKLTKFQFQLTFKHKNITSAKSMLQNLNSKFKIDNFFTLVPLRFKYLTTAQV